MHVSQKGLNFIKSFEGFSSKPYRCPAGYKTIGYGHLIKDNENIESVTKSYAVELLKQDVEAAESIVRRFTKVFLTQNQFDMLVSFVFNLGGGAYQRSSLRSKVNREEHEAVPFEFLKWIYSKGDILPGLLRRRRLEAKIYVG